VDGLTGKINPAVLGVYRNLEVYDSHNLHFTGLLLIQ
jgi:hypothetical protein